MTRWISPPFSTRPWWQSSAVKCCYTASCCEPVRYRVKMRGVLYRYCVRHFALTGLKPARNYR